MDAAGKYAADIVLIILKTEIEFRSYIAPICIPYNLRYEATIVTAGSKG